MPKPTRSLRTPGLLPFLVLLFSSPPATAVDGVLEINQACATVTGCFAGDTPGFPVQITTPGSYRLTSELALPDANTTGLQAQASAQDVSIDLNGFRIVCPACATGTGDGIDAAAGVRLGVRNGSIVGVGNAGIDAVGSLVVERVAVAQARSHGIRTTGSASVSDCIVHDNIGDGIQVGPESRVTRSLARQNFARGIVIGSGLVSESRVTLSNAQGILCTSQCTIHRNVVTGNFVSGILSPDSSVQDNALSGNGLGIDSARSLVLTNSMTLNATEGLNAGAFTGYGSNQLEFNNGGGSEVSGGIQIDLNGCESGLCP